MSEAHQELEDDLPPDADAERGALEARARTMGWKPLTEYRGPPGRWTDAEEFILKGEVALPVMRDNNRRMSERLIRQDGEITGLRTTVDEMKQVITDLRDMAQRSNKQGYDRAMAEIEQRKRVAVEAGDTTAYDALVTEAERMARERPAPAVTPKADEAPPAPVAPQAPPEVTAFIAANPWFKTDAFLMRQMTAKHEAVIAEYPDMPLDEQLDEALIRLKEEFPTRFGMSRAPDNLPPEPPAPRPRRPGVPLVTPPSGNGGGNPPRAPRTSGIDSIADPEDRKQARAAFNRMKRNVPDYTEAEYMTVYNDPHADILADTPGRKK